MTVTIEPMSDAHYGGIHPSQVPWPPQHLSAPGHVSSRPPRWPTYLSLVLAVVATGIAIAGWFRAPRVETAPPKTFTSHEMQEARSNVCDAYGKVRQLTTVVTGKDRSDPASAFAIVVNARLGVHAGAQYLESKLLKNPATPVELTEEVQKLSDAYYEMAIGQLGDAPEGEMTPIVQSIDNADKEITRLCK